MSRAPRSAPPAGTTRRPARRAAAAALALLLAAGLPLATAGPREARARWREAMALHGASWRERAGAWRAVRRETVPTDGYYARALAAEARVLREAGHPSAAAAAEMAAASAGPRREPDRWGHALTAARTWIEEGDAAGARPLLEDVLASAGSSDPGRTAAALDLLGRLASEAGDAATLEALLRRAAHDAADRVDVTLVLLDRLGLLALARADASAAHRAHAAQRRAFLEAQRAGEDRARWASRAWLGLALPARLLQAQGR